MTEEERAKKIAERNEAHKKEIEKRKAAEIKAGFLNPFGEGTSYKEFLAEVKKSKMEVSAYCKGKISEDQIAWLEKDLALLTNKED